MTEFITAIVVFSIFYVPLRLMRNAWLQGQLPAFMRVPAGIAAWGALLTAAAPPIVFLWVIIDIFAHANMGAIFTIGSLLFLASIVGYLVVGNPEVIDYVRMKEFWYRSLFFQNPAVRRDNIFHEAEWHEITKIHEQQSHSTPARETHRNPELPRITTADAVRELQKHRSEPVPRADLGAELQRLKDGEVVDVTDAFRLNMYRRKSHWRYDDILSMAIDPTQGMLKVQMLFPQARAGSFATADGKFRLLQDVYDVLHAVAGELWLQHYATYFSTLAVECFRVELDSFDMPTQIPFLRVHCPVTDLRLHADKIYIVTELTRLRRAEWIG